MLASRHWILGVLVIATAASVAPAEDGGLQNPFRVEHDSKNSVQQTAGAEAIARPVAHDPNHRSMQQLGVDIGLPSGKLPDNLAAGMSMAMPLAGNLPRPWPTQVVHWQAAATRHQPLYFEDINAERYGYSRNWVCQPFASTAHFFATIPALPYLKATNCPGECQYTLGHYRPGSCPPYRRHCWPVDGLGAAAEAGTLAWLIFVLP